MWHLRIMMQPAAIKGGCGEAHFVSAEQRADDDVTAGAESAVDLNHDTAAQPFAHECLVGFGNAEFPRRAGMLDGGQRRCAGAAFETRNGDVIRARLGDTGGDGADADFGDQLHRDRAVGIDVLQVVDELREIFDGIDVVMRRRRDQADTRRRMAHLGDGRVHLVAGQLTAFAGLGTLRHLDLHHVGVDEVFRRHAEAARGNLLDRPSASSRRSASAYSGRIPRRLRRCWTCRRCGFIAIASVVCASREIEP